MNSPTVQYVEHVRRGQEAVTTALLTWSDAVQNYAGTLYSGQFPLPNAHAAVNAAFDLATQMLAQQREFANTLLDAGTRASEAIASVGEAVATAGTEAPEAANEAGDKLTGQARGTTPPRGTQAAQSSNETTKRNRTERTPAV